MFKIICEVCSGPSPWAFSVVVCRLSSSVVVLDSIDFRGRRRRLTIENEKILKSKGKEESPGARREEMQDPIHLSGGVEREGRILWVRKQHTAETPF